MSNKITLKNQYNCFNNKHYIKKEIAKMKKNIKEYIDENAYLLKTDTTHTVQLHLKPRIVAQSVENSCITCKKNKCVLNKCKNYKYCEKRYLVSNFTKGMHYAIKYINERDKD